MLGLGQATAGKAHWPLGVLAQRQQRMARAQQFACAAADQVQQGLGIVLGGEPQTQFGQRRQALIAALEFAHLDGQFVGQQAHMLAVELAIVRLQRDGRGALQRKLDGAQDDIRLAGFG